MKKAFLVIVAMSMLLVGCVSNYNPAPPLAADPAANKLAESAVSVSNSLITLEGIQKADHPGFRKALPAPLTPGMARLASVDWTGPIGPLALRLATAAGCRYQELGNPPAIPVIVAVHVQNQPIALILRDIDYQAGTKADIAVYARSRIVELRYAPSGGWFYNTSAQYRKIRVRYGDFSKYVK